MAALPQFPALPQNDPARAGELAAPKQLFGPCSRYAVAPIHTRFGELEFFVWDAHISDPDGFPEVIRQEAELAKAYEGLDLSHPFDAFDDEEGLCPRCGDLPPCCHESPYCEPCLNRGAAVLGDLADHHQV